MKKFVFILNALDIVARLLKGERVEGVLYQDKDTGVITFKAWNRTAPKHYRERKLGDLDNGWVGETEKHVTRHEKFAKSMGLTGIMASMERDNHQSIETLLESELIEFV